MRFCFLLPKKKIKIYILALDLSVEAGCEAITPRHVPWLKCDKRDLPNMKLWVTCCWLVCASLHTYMLLQWWTAHTHTFISTGRDVPDIGHTRHKWSTVPEEYVTVSWFIHVVSNLSLLFSCFKGETSAPLLPFSFCKHSMALLHMIFKLLIKHNTKDYPWLTSTNNMAWVYLIRLINMFSRFREVRLVQHQWM